MSNNWTDFNDAEDQYDVIPAGTLAKVHMAIKKGGYNDTELKLSGGYATRNPKTGAIYLDCEFTVLEGKYAKRKVWSNIGIHSVNGEKWGKMGRSFVKAILNSARGLNGNDKSDEAQQKRQFQNGFSDLDGLEFIAKIEVETDNNGNPRNRIQKTIDAGHKDYAALMNGTYHDSSNQSATSSGQQQSSSERPDWA